MHWREARGMMARSGQRAERHRGVGRPRSSHARLAHRPSGLGRANPDARQLAHSALARAHGVRRVAFQRFDMIEAFTDAVAQVSSRNIRTDADERPLVIWNVLRRL